MNEQTMTSESMLDRVMNESVIGDEAAAARFESAPVASDQRRSYRYPAQSGRESATVQHGKRSWKASLREESAGGMALDLAGQFPLAEGDEVEVGIYTGWYRARIVHIQPVEGGQQIGLQRISVISNAEDDQAATRRREPKSPGQMRNLVAVAFVALALGMAVTSFLGRGFGKPGASKSNSAIPAHFADRPRNDRLKGMLEGVNLLLEPEIANGLALSRQQQQSIEGVMVGASNSLGEAFKDSEGQPPHVWYQSSQNIVNDALENILCSLTDDQIVKWRAMMIHRRSARDAS